jgi:molybdopterin molybdotransferase
MLALEEARERIFKLLPPSSLESIPTSGARGRFTAAQVISPIDLPLFDNSAMDGYAVRSADLVKASREQSVSLQVMGEIPAGAVPGVEVSSGKSARVFTGSPLPAGADAVIMQEDTQADGRQVCCFDRVRPWENIRLRGEDIRKGTVLLKAGERISAAAVGLLRAVGLAEIEAARQPRVAVIATGDELVEPGQPLTDGKIYESNRALISSLLQGLAGSVRIFPVIRDSLETTTENLRQAFELCDVIISSGGVSVGEHDFVKAAFQKLGGTIDLWRVSIKPGKPFVCGQLGAKLLFGLPGNPVSTFVTFLLLVRPALLRWQGATDWELPQHPGMLEEALSNAGDRRHFMRVKVDANGGVRLAGTQASHVMSSMAGANGLVDVPPNSTLEKGRWVQVLRWEI